MLSWQWPYLIALLPLPLFVRWLSKGEDTSASAIEVPFFNDLQNLNQSQLKLNSASSLIGSLLWLIWLSLLIAAARPTWVGEPRTRIEKNRLIATPVPTVVELNSDEENTAIIVDNIVKAK